MKEIGHTIYSGLLGLVCMVDTICCGVRKEGKQGGRRKKEKKGEALALDAFNPQ